MVVFLRWWLIACLTLAGLYTAVTYDMHTFVHKADMTHISFVILVLFLIMSVFVGRLTFQARRGDQDFARHLPFSYFVSQCFLGLGMVGTLAGFLSLQGAFTLTGDPSFAIIVQKMQDIGKGLSTAGVSTLIGLACSMLLDLQLQNLEYQLDERQ